MRDNQPVAQREYTLPGDVTLMSTTDVQSRITYAHEAFVHVSGFMLEELQRQPHNLLRHPDMPAEAFADMWATLKGDEPKITPQNAALVEQSSAASEGLGKQATPLVEAVNVFR